MPVKSVRMLHAGEHVKAMLSTDGLVVVGSNGKLRLYDPPRRVCHGKQNGCLCAHCDPSKWTKAQQSFPAINTTPKRCECDRPINNDGSCLSCGKPISQLRQAA